MLHLWNSPAELIEVALEHEDIRRGASGPASYADLVLIANLLGHASSLDPATTEAIWELPASRKLGLDAGVLPDLSADAAECEADFRSSLAA